MIPTELAKFVDLPDVADPLGNLCFVESDQHFPFESERIYDQYDVPGKSIRSGQAHHQLNQRLIALSGTVCLVLESAYYDQNDYIPHFDEFLRFAGE